MTKVLNLFLTLMLGFSMVWFTACGETKSTTETAQTDTEATSETDTEEPEEDKSQRPSPPAEATATIGGATVTINYSSPAVKGRTVWGDLVPYGEVWRTGANEATTFEVDKAITVNGETLPAGKYGLFTIPAEDGWTIIFNSVWDQWGAYEYDNSKDALRVSASSRALDSGEERMKFDIADDGTVTLTWDQLAVDFTVAAGS